MSNYPISVHPHNGAVMVHIPEGDLLHKPQLVEICNRYRQGHYTPPHLPPARTVAVPITEYLLLADPSRERQ